jgi:hypothetical protein
MDDNFHPAVLQTQNQFAKFVIQNGSRIEMHVVQWSSGIYEDPQLYIQSARPWIDRGKLPDGWDPSDTTAHKEALTKMA